MRKTERTMSDKILICFYKPFFHDKTFVLLETFVLLGCWFCFDGPFIHLFVFIFSFQTAKGYILLFDVVGGRDEKYLYEPVYPK